VRTREKSMKKTLHLVPLMKIQTSLWKKAKQRPDPRVKPRQGILAGKARKRALEVRLRKCLVKIKAPLMLKM
jgi:hypothetical protein